MTHAPLGALELTGIGSKLNSRIGYKIRCLALLPS
jgi:hypothetical protein